MLKLRPEQIDQIGQWHLMDRAAAHMRQNHADFAALDPAMTRQFIEDAVSAALGYGLATDRGVMTFVLVAWFLGPEFIEEFPEADVILRNPKAGEADRAGHLYRWAWKRLGEEQP